ncbi:MAG TPA: histidine phosphatase family protein [Solirubrobacteraceae bacterium]|nr:histidine phosphatase family protein [Solirubrobacteraceae bacterium]
MARELWLLRHGDAEPGDGRPDEERRLTERGERQATAAGAALAAIGAEFALVLTSPRLRALQTAQLACQPLGLEPAEHSPLSGGFGREDALAVLEGKAADARVLVVGHEPDFSQTVHDLAGGRIDLKKGGLAAVSVESGEGELLLLMRPRELAGLAEAGTGAI